MNVGVCQIAVVEAPVERVWKLLSEPANYALWWEAQTRSITPEGPAQPGQRIYAQLVPFQLSNADKKVLGFALRAKEHDYGKADQVAALSSWREEIVVYEAA